MKYLIHVGNLVGILFFTITMRSSTSIEPPPYSSDYLSHVSCEDNSCEHFSSLLVTALVYK